MPEGLGAEVGADGQSGGRCRSARRSTTIEVSEQPLSSAWNTTQYTLDGVPITNQAVKSAFELPFGATLKAGRQRG